MKKQLNIIEFKLPEWISDYCEKYTATKNLNKRMKFVIEAAHENVARETGGPFAAAIFQKESGELVSLGVNLVTTEGMSMLHAEMVAIAVAQKSLSTCDLGGNKAVMHELVASTEPCAMCFSSIPWSGVSRVITGALDQDARNIGFDEGPKPEDWIGELERRGIEVIDKMERKSAAQVLIQYKENNGRIYNSRESYQGAAVDQ